MTTISKMTETLATIGIKFNVEGIDIVEVGAMDIVRKAEGKLAHTYAYLVAAGILPSDYLSAKNKDSTASVEQYAARVEAAGMVCYTKAERAELATKLPKDTPAEQKASRKVLQDRRTEFLKTVRRGLITAHKLADPDFYTKKGGANEAKTAIEKFAKQIGEALKTLRGDGVFPDNFPHDDAVAVLVGYEKTFLK